GAVGARAVIGRSRTRGLARRRPDARLERTARAAGGAVNARDAPALVDRRHHVPALLAARRAKLLHALADPVCLLFHVRHLLNFHSYPLPPDHHLYLYVMRPLVRS